MGAHILFAHPQPAQLAPVSVCAMKLDLNRLAQHPLDQRIAVVLCVIEERTSVEAAEIVAMALNPDAFWKGSEGEMADARAQASEVAEILNYWLACKGLPPLEELTP